MLYLVLCLIQWLRPLWSKALQVPSIGEGCVISITVPYCQYPLFYFSSKVWNPGESCFYAQLWFTEWIALSSFFLGAQSLSLSTQNSLILDFVYAHRAGCNGQIGIVWLPWKIFVYAVLFWAKKSSEITLCKAENTQMKIIDVCPGEKRQFF